LYEVLYITANAVPNYERKVVERISGESI
jgi:hypothetical protein